MAAEAIANNGMQILTREKFVKLIKKTVVYKFKNGLHATGYYDKDGAEITLDMCPRPDAPIGEVEEKPWDREYIKYEN